MFFQSWAALARAAALAAITYTVLVAALRLIGEQALAKMSAYDLIVTIALGSVLIAIPLTPGITLAEGLAAIATIFVLQELTRWLVKRSSRIRRVVKERPKLVLWEGRLLCDRMAQINLTAEEVRAAVRRRGLGDLAQAQAVVLESDGDWSVVPLTQAGGLSAFHEDFELP